MDDLVKKLQSREFHELAVAMLAPYASSREDVEQLVHDLSELLDAWGPLHDLAADLGGHLTDSQSVEGRVRLLILLGFLRGWLQLEVCKHGESFVKLCDAIEDNLYDRVIADGMDEDELSARILKLTEERYGGDDPGKTRPPR